MSDGVSIFGIRHHGPGCARSLCAALDALRPDCVLIEGPAGCESLLTHLADEQLRPPVALLSYSVDAPDLAVFHPYAEFSPEWQALAWATRHATPVRFMDVPAGITLAWQRQARTDGTEGSSDESRTAPDESQPTIDADDALSDPLDWLAHAAGFADGESWWNHLVEERGDGEGLFEAIAQAMTELRDNAKLSSRLDRGHEAVREAHMRMTLREARQQGHQRIAVICGAWHVPALARATTAAADQREMKGVERLKTQTTWVPWTHRHLSMRSGYGAGVASPGWYEFLWRNAANDARAVGWFARIARLLRERDLDCSSAHLIEAARLADTLAALRGRPAPGLDEINEATLSVICAGDPMPMRLIADELVVGDAIGSVPSSVPAVPLQRDLDAQTRRLRLKPEALARTLDLDLRNDTDLQRSHLLHRLGLLDISWGRKSQVGRSAKGTFHEIWELSWEPRFEIDLVIASRHGQTLELAAAARAIEQSTSTERLADLAALIDRVLLADLPGTVQAIAAELESRAATDADPLALLAALPALANIHRYGNVRNTDVAQVAHLFDSMLLRAALGMPLALSGLADEAAEAARNAVLGADRAVTLRNGEEQTEAWRHALRVVAMAESGTALLRGLCTRLLLDASSLARDDVRSLLAQQLSQGADALAAANWLDGFLNRNATVLLHDDSVWSLIDDWLGGLGSEHFVRIVPLLRRAFAQFEAADRRDLGQRAQRPAAVPSAAVGAPHWDETRALRALPMLRELLGIADGQ